jgi:probable metal-binding protein
MPKIVSILNNLDGTQEKMDKIIHAHALMDFIEENPNLLSIQELKTEFEKQFGEVKFTNCTNQIYDLEEIFTFLTQRNKIRKNSEGIEVIKEHRCDHD